MRCHPASIITAEPAAVRAETPPLKRLSRPPFKRSGFPSAPAKMLAEKVNGERPDCRSASLLLYFPANDEAPQQPTSDEAGKRLFCPGGAARRNGFAGLCRIGSDSSWRVWRLSRVRLLRDRARRT